MARKLLTRVELWVAICKKYPPFQYFSVNGSWRHWGSYVRRDRLFQIVILMKIHKSRHLTKIQKAKIKYELDERIVDKI